MLRDRYNSYGRRLELARLELLDGRPLQGAALKVADVPVVVFIGQGVELVEENTFYQRFLFGIQILQAPMHRRRSTRFPPQQHEKGFMDLWERLIGHTLLKVHSITQVDVSWKNIGIAFLHICQVRAALAIKIRLITLFYSPDVQFCNLWR